MIATDVAARGLDVDDVKVVITRQPPRCRVWPPAWRQLLPTAVPGRNVGDVAGDQGAGGRNWNRSSCSIAKPTRSIAAAVSRLRWQPPTGAAMPPTASAWLIRRKARAKTGWPTSASVVIMPPVGHGPGLIKGSAVRPAAPGPAEEGTSPRAGPDTGLPASAAAAASQENEPGARVPLGHQAIQARGEQPGLQGGIGARRPFPGRDADAEEVLQLPVSAGISRCDGGGDRGFVRGQRAGFHQHPAGLGLGGDVRGDRSRDGVQDVARGPAGFRQPGDSRIDALTDAAVPFSVQGDEQGFLAVEVQVGGAFRHSGLRGDVGHRRGVVAGIFPRIGEIVPPEYRAACCSCRTYPPYSRVLAGSGPPGRSALPQPPRTGHIPAYIRRNDRMWGRPATICDGSELKPVR